MLSSQGASVKTRGVVVRQTIGQQSVTGNFTNSKFIVGQGFQQSNKLTTSITPKVTTATLTYPNPFIDKVNFQFSSAIDGAITIVLFDSLGRLVYSAEKYPINNILTIDNLFFPAGQYFVKLTANNYTYTTKLLKTK
jgi:hypothetical protein